MPLAASAQQSERMRRIGVLMHTPADEPKSQARLAAFQDQGRRAQFAHRDYRYGRFRSDAINASETDCLAEGAVIGERISVGRWPVKCAVTGIFLRVSSLNRSFRPRSQDRRRKASQIQPLGHFPVFWQNRGISVREQEVPVERNRGISSPKQVMFQSFGKNHDGRGACAFGSVLRQAFCLRRHP